MAPSAAEKEVRKVTPPLITSGHVAERVCGYRPVRDGSPVMEVVEEGSKLVAHNYGHGGSGWTIAPGATSYVTRELANRMTARGYTSEEPICIVGAGVMGLFCARDLVLLGYTNVTIRAAAYDDLTSHKAGGLWAPAYIKMETAEAEATVRRMFKYSIDFYKAVVANPSDPLHRGVVNVPLYSAKTMPYLEGLMDSPKQVVLDFENGVKRQVYAFDDAIYIETNVIMQILGELLRMSGVRFECVKVTKLSELAERVVVNCTGLGARELVGDTKLHPNLGALLLLKGQDIPRESLQYMVHTDAKEGLLYYFPKHSLTISADHRDRAGAMGVLGGCCIEVKDETVRNEEEFDRILRDARWFFYGDEDGIV